MLGCDVYNEGEKFVWFIIIVIKGIEGFIDKLFDSEEYFDNFGFEIVFY